jgi:hypothetical protein
MSLLPGTFGSYSNFELICELRYARKLSYINNLEAWRYDDIDDTIEAIENELYKRKIHNQSQRSMFVKP